MRTPETPTPEIIYHPFFESPHFPFGIKFDAALCGQLLAESGMTPERIAAQSMIILWQNLTYHTLCTELTGERSKLKVLLKEQRAMNDSKWNNLITTDRGWEYQENPDSPAFTPS
ncbi:hypothetical protein HYS92_01620 [Candidatus Daviesbacteria bacterium]|nr:hypothetical protein [Candidatus Daviesbacteria bacterium]